MDYSKLFLLRNLDFGSPSMPTVLQCENISHLLTILKKCPSVKIVKYHQIYFVTLFFKDQLLLLSE